MSKRVLIVLGALWGTLALFLLTGCDVKVSCPLSVRHRLPLRSTSPSICASITGAVATAVRVCMPI